MIPSPSISRNDGLRAALQAWVLEWLLPKGTAGNQGKQLLDTGCPCWQVPPSVFHLPFRLDRGMEGGQFQQEMERISIYAVTRWKLKCWLYPYVAL